MRNHRCIPRACLLLAALVLAGAAAAADTTDVRTDATARSAAAVIAVDKHWSKAEVDGDTAWLDGMLLPQYRSIGADGKVTTKADILAHAAKNHGSKATRQMIAAWRKAHPSSKKVTLLDRIAILSFVSGAPATRGKLYSSDIFVYVDGRWHALYSQHTDLGKR